MNVLLIFIEKAGYERVDFVHDKGEFDKWRNFDIFSTIYNNPIRILFDFEKLKV